MKAIEAALRRPAVVITNAVGTMTCAIVFALIALVALPGAIASGSVVTIVIWASSSFLQLVLLSVLALGQQIQGEATEAVLRETHDIAQESRAEVKVMLEELLELSKNNFS